MALYGSILYFIYTCLYYACFVEETLACASAIKAGAEEVAGITRERYMQRLRWLKEASRFSLIRTHDEKQRTAFMRISNLLESLRLDSANGKIRKQPYLVVLCGPPGCGKTGTAMRLAGKLLRSRYGKFRPSDIVTLNETDEFQSEYRTNHKVVIFDDVGAEHINLQGVNPWRKVIDFVNNIRKTSLNPNLELKGNVYIEPDLVIVTTNLTPSLWLNAWLACPDAIVRRISTMLYLHNYDSAMKLVKTSGTNIQIQKGAFRNNVAFDFNEQSLELDLHQLEGLLDEEIAIFNDHLDRQQIYVDNMNANLDEDLAEMSVYDCLYNDQIYPRLPKCVPLPYDQERRLPWYHRLIREFCVYDNSMAVCQSSITSQDELNYSSDEELFLTHKEMWLDHVFNEENYWILRHFLLEQDLTPVSFGFISSTGTIYVHPNKIHMVPKDPDSLRTGYIYTLEELDDAHVRYMQQKDSASAEQI